ncbi:MAG: TonB-dependent receptor plug domain-containing protein [Vicinamibacterales bacterium]
MQAFRTFVLGVAIVGLVVTPALAQDGTSTASGQQAQGLGQAQQGQAQGQQQPPPPPKTEDPTYKETVVVSASKTEQQLVNAPATMTVIGPRALEVAPSNNYADLLRAVPGVNITQISARDINVTSRGATSSLATSQLAVLDGRSLYQDFFGFVMWDFMPSNPNEIKQIEVIRGPASAVWGANALSGVVNIITKSPREMQGTTLTMGAGTFGREFFGNGKRDGSLVYGNITHAAAINDAWAYKLSVGSYQSDPFGRPSGNIPGGTTTYPAFENTGTFQPKVDVRFDWDGTDGQNVQISGGFAGTDGIMHSGIGPFDIQSGTKYGYGKINYTKNAFRAQAFMNYLDGDANNLLSADPAGNPITFLFNTKTFDLEVGDTRTFGGRHVVTYGGNLRFNKFNLTIAPGETSRTEGGVYAQDEMFLNDHVRFVVGARVDKFTSIADPVFSPRVALMLKPSADQTFRFSFNRAFRAPSMINNNLDLIIGTIVPLGQINAAYGSALYRLPTEVMGNPDLTEERLDAFEISYTGTFNDRVTLSAAYYYNKFTEQIFFTQNAAYGPTEVPAGFPGLGPVPASLIWAGVYQAGVRFPKSFTYLNLGEVNQQGLELGIDASLSASTGMFANYSYQAEPDPNFDLSEVNLPPTHRFSTGFNYSGAKYFGSASVNYTSDAFWQDILDARFHGTTEAHLTANASAGFRFGGGRYSFTMKAVNLTDKQYQSHVFGDIMRRQIVGELRVSLPR